MKLLRLAQEFDKTISNGIKMNVITYYECVQLSKRINHVIILLDKEPKNKDIEKTINVLLIVRLNLELSITAVKEYELLKA